MTAMDWGNSCWSRTSTASADALLARRITAMASAAAALSSSSAALAIFRSDGGDGLGKQLLVKDQHSVSGRLACAAHHGHGLCCCRALIQQRGTGDLPI